MPDLISILLAVAALAFLTGAGTGLLRTGMPRPHTPVLIAVSVVLALLLGATFLFPSTTFRLFALACCTLCCAALVVVLSVMKRTDGVLSDAALESLLVAPLSPAVIVVDRDGTILVWSRAAEELFGYTAEKMKGTHKLLGLCPPPGGETDDPLSGIIAQSMQSGEKQVRSLQAMAANGNCPWVQITVLPQFSGKGKASGALLLVEDVTERMEKEEWLRDRAASFRELAESIADMFFAFDADARCTYWNRASEGIFGISERDAVGKDVRELFGQRTDSGIDEFCLRGLHTHEHNVYTTELETGTEDGPEKRSFEISTYPTKTGISVFGRDVTWRKQAYDQLLYQSNILKNVLNSVIVTDLDGRITYWNHIAARTFGYRHEELLGKTAALIYPGQDEQRFLADVAETARGIDWVGEWEGRRKDGSPVWVDFKRTLMRNGEGNPIGIVGVSVDITERKQAQRQLEESEEKYRELGESISDIFFALDRDFCITYWNKASEIFTGTPRTTAAGKQLSEVLPPLASPDILVRYREVIHAARPLTFETRIPLGGQALVFESSAYPTRTGISVFVRDITERKRTMLALRESERKKRAILNALPDLMLVVSVEGTVLESKLDEHASLLIVPGPYTGRHLGELFAPPLDETLMHQLRQVIAQKAGVTFEFRSGADVHARHYEARIVLSGAAEALLLIRDITERRQAEEELQSSLHEKEALLKEIHHRVKNNLQIISSLLSLQSQQIKNPKALAALTESQGRVRSMALIHEQLYQSQDLGQIDFGQYVRDLSAHLFRTYKSEGEHVTLSVEVTAVFLDVDQAIPCGMIINELLSNCLKHAFPRQQKGSILIAARWERDGQLCLVVEDTGEGIPPDVDLANSPSLGLKLVRMLADQLKGTLTHTNQEGTSFHLLFRPHPVKAV